ncbi:MULTISPECIES: GTP 3',8-cyclase MoaA [Terrisporobacter]|uniref:GTP 3',8-cyclase n=1 Tax=Terrisporobacter othiniensis TaxID=1577792 RepID=A0A0B3W294_9FIRM|nr:MULTISPECIES: GTP 3',8-cyclase MoaA [Terrisporobacter]KHS56437.1 molybdenum cofactor biosynthesis protein MoeA [Terrisporobacter othiniensis]MCC3670447.1 GTP 3',8-cyclase MoaA [Terrisporobacter mayombei]MDU6984805.1 GTP 3',8-cyclase MoaA [Terrisporobacter othiniensis]
MIDKLNRKIEYMRISVTDRCNLRCVYCMPEEGIENISHEEILSYDEIIRICKCIANLGIKKIKITGGEPLVRKDIIDLIKEIKGINGIDEVTITTNGVLLYEMADQLYEAGIDAINISLDTLNRDKFLKITRRDKYENVSMAIEKLIDLGVRVKINCLAIKENNLSEIVKIAAYSKNNNIDVRFIELMPIGYGKNYTGISNEVILGLLEDEYGSFKKVKEKRGNGPAVYYKNDKFKGYIGLISAISNEFCETCNRVRLTANGFLKLCLHYNKGIDLKEPIRSDITDKELENMIYHAIRNKPLGHNFYHDSNIENVENKNMVQIGG